MDYKYIEQLLERYWAAETSLEEERILRAFFSDDAQVPEHLKRYTPLFAGWQAAGKVTLGADFDEKVLAVVEKPIVKARPLTMHMRLMPLCKAAAVIALLFSAGAVSQRSMDDMAERPAQIAATESNDSTVEVQVAYESVQARDSITVVDETLLK